jgi:hypothetical protein
VFKAVFAKVGQQARHCHTHNAGAPFEAPAKPAFCCNLQGPPFEHTMPYFSFFQAEIMDFPRALDIMSMHS